MARTNNTAKKVEAAATVVEAEGKKGYPTTEQMIKDGMTTKSARIRHLHSLGMSVGEIARQETGGLYQHAYNVIKKPLKGKDAPAVASTESAETSAQDADSLKEGEKA